MQRLRSRLAPQGRAEDAGEATLIRPLQVSQLSAPGIHLDQEGRLRAGFNHKVQSVEAGQLQPSCQQFSGICHLIILDPANDCRGSGGAVGCDDRYGHHG
jgi:hypothetical protein